MADNQMFYFSISLLAIENYKSHTQLFLFAATNIFVNS